MKSLELEQKRNVLEADVQKLVDIFGITDRNQLADKINKQYEDKLFDELFQMVLRANAEHKLGTYLCKRTFCEDSSSIASEILSQIAGIKLFISAISEMTAKIHQHVIDEKTSRADELFDVRDILTVVGLCIDAAGMALFLEELNELYDRLILAEE